MFKSISACHLNSKMFYLREISLMEGLKDKSETFSVDSSLRNVMASH